MVYEKGESLPVDYIKQVEEFQSELIADFFHDPYTFSIGFVINEEGKVQGVGLIRVINEFKMQLNPELSNLTKVRVIKDLLNEAISRRHCGEILAMITQGGASYVGLLEKHFNFHRIDGTPLKWEI